MEKKCYQMESYLFMLNMFFAAICGNFTPVKSVSVTPLRPEQHAERMPKMV